MNKYLPLFPLNLVVFPFEKLNLHIFEDRYKQLVNECVEEKKTFGIPAFINKKMELYGTEMHIVKLDKRYDDGKLDVRTEGKRVFKILDFENPAPEKLYAAGNVNVFDLEDAVGDLLITTELIQKIEELYNLLRIQITVDFTQKEYFSYEAGHKLGLSIEQEYELLKIERETDRQIFLLDHLARAIPIVAEIERTKERIRMNGHFKNLDPLNF